MTENATPIRVREECEGSLLRITLARPRANLVDRAMVAAIREVVQGTAGAASLRTVLFDHDGPHFSFGASVAEHRADEVREMLGEFHQFFRDLHATGKVFLAAVRGRCLGGGFELAAFCHRVFAAPDAHFGNPEIRLGVFAPVASVVLPYRVRQPVVDDMLLTGRTLDARAALEAGLIDELADDPAARALTWHAEGIAPLSGAALQHAVRAARHRLGEDLAGALAALEHQYLERLMRTHDAHEGIAAFLEKREPTWKHE